MPVFNSQFVINDVVGLEAVLNNKASITPEAWQDLVLATSWANYGAGFSTPQCRKLVGNLIEVKGIIKKSTALVTNEVIATLPVGYRPSEIMLIATWAGGGTSRLQVEPSGAIKLASGSSNGVGLNFFFGL